MKQLANEHSLALMAEVLDVSRAGYYREDAPPGKRAQEDAVITASIKRVYAHHRSRYGSPRIWTDLRQQGLVCGENRVARLMRLAGLKALSSRRKKPRTTESSHDGPIAPNLLKGRVITRAHEAWVMDITYVASRQGWVYLAVVLDLHLHKVVGWQLANHLNASLVTEALTRAAQRQNYPSGVIVHSDRGCQYASRDFIRLTEALGYTRSMSAKGNCYDNATMESFFGVIKREELDRWDMQDLAVVRHHVFEYIETYYNRIRIHTALGMSPDQFEQQTQPPTPSAEFSKALNAPQVGHEKAGETAPRPRPVVALSEYPSAGCSPAEPTCVSPDTSSIQQTNHENNNKKEHTLTR